MKRKNLIARAALVGVFVIVVIIAFLSATEPRYQGRSLNSWLQQCAETPLMETQRLAEAQQAVRTVGAPKALPELLRLVKTRDGRVRAWLVEKSEKFDGRFIRLRSASELQLRGIAGFEALGTNAEPAVGELTKLLDDKELTFVAARCLENIGHAAEVSLCRCLTNQDTQVRRLSVFALASVTEDVEVYLNRIKDRLADNDPGVRFAVVQAIGVQDNAPDLVVPLLISALADAEDSVCGEAASALAGFGTNAASSFSILTNLAITGRPGQVGAALKALPSVAPVEAIPVLSNVVVNGSSAVLGNALRGLKTVAPELAMEMTLAAFRSSDSQRRLRAVSVAGSCDLNTPGLANALKLAATDPDAEVSKRAAMTMRQMVNKQKERSGNVILFPGEPNYDGKPLAEWLRHRKQDWELSEEAVKALRQMGTNVIPPLLARLAYREPVFGLHDYDVSMEAVGAFISLRQDANAALPALAELMNSDNPELALRAMLATLGAGSNAVPCLMRGLTNQYADVRNEAANYLTGEWSDNFPEARKQAMPLLLKLLDDPDQSVRISATNGIKQLEGRNAGVAQRR